MHRRERATGLTAVGVGATVRLCAIDLPGVELLRLAELGLRLGAILTVLGRTAGGGRLIGIGTSRIAVDQGTARRLAVELPR